MPRPRPPAPPGHKVCYKCRTAKPFTEFHANRRQPDGHDNRCKPCRSDPVVIRAESMAKYGITQRKWEFAFAMQGRCCALCGGSSPRSKHGWLTDHDHTTGKVRGILCYPCNAVIGYMDKGWSNPFGLAMKYLDDPPFSHHMDMFYGLVDMPTNLSVDQ